MNNKYIEYLKNSYKRVQAPVHLQESGWDRLYQKIQEQDRGFSLKIWISRISFVAIITILVVSSMLGLFKVASAAMPGSQFYPIKKLGEKVIEATTGNYEVAIDNRAKEIVNLASEKEITTTVLEKTVKEYSQTVQKTKIQVEEDDDDEKKANLNKKLSEHGKRFDKAAQENPSAQKELKEAIRATRQEEREEVNGKSKAR